jgi:hypothetical protein
MTCSCYGIGTKVECTLLAVRRNLFREQTWGRAVRASQNSRELGALLICGCFSAVAIQTRAFRPWCKLHLGLPAHQQNKSLRVGVSPLRHCRALHERGARAYICTKPCTLHRLCLGYDVPPCDSPNPEIRVWSGGCKARDEGKPRGGSRP